MPRSNGAGGDGGPMKRSGRKRAEAEHPSRIPARQWKLKAGYQRDGSSMLYLRELLDAPETDASSLTDLTEEQQAELTAERIRHQRKFRISLVGIGTIDKERAIAEVRALSPAGRTLIEIEKRAIRMAIEDAREESRGLVTP